jgi:hypothetical protein
MKYLLTLTLLAACQTEGDDPSAVRIPVTDTDTVIDPTDPIDPPGPGDESIYDLDIYYLDSAIDCEYTSAYIEIKVLGLPDELLLDIYETGGGTYYETHSASLVSQTDRISIWALEMSAGGAYVDGEETSVTCSNMARATRWVSYSARLYDQGELADCNVFGADPMAVIENEFRPEDVNLRNCEIAQ